MATRLIELHRQRGRLLERIAAQRSALAEQLTPVLAAERLGLRGLGLLEQALQRLKSHPLPLLLAFAALLIVKPCRVWRGVRLGLWLWRRYRSLRRLMPPALWSYLFPESGR